jgi:hypothetical protein
LGYFYVTSANFQMYRAYSLNDWINEPGEPYHAGLTTWEWLDGIEGVDPSLFRTKAIQHEVGAVANSHLGRQNVAAGSFPACGQLNQALERLVAGNHANLISLAEDAIDRAVRAVWYLSDHPYVNGFQGAPNPVAEWLSAARPAVRDSLQDVTTGTFPAPSSTHCDVSGV